jgi:hypothetical protein
MHGVRQTDDIQIHSRETHALTYAPKKVRVWGMWCFVYAKQQPEHTRTMGLSGRKTRVYHLRQIDRGSKQPAKASSEYTQDERPHRVRGLRYFDGREYEQTLQVQTPHQSRRVSKQPGRRVDNQRTRDAVASTRLRC